MKEIMSPSSHEKASLRLTVVELMGDDETKRKKARNERGCVVCVEQRQPVSVYSFGIRLKW